MIKEHDIRLGICECSSVFQGRLEGRVVDMSGAGYRFKLKEISVSADNYDQMRDQLRDNRCHMFLDVHPKEDGFNTEFLVNDLIHCNPRYRESLYIGGMRLQFGKRWERVGVPTVEELTGAIPEIFAQIISKRGTIDVWLARMTPPSWVIPEQIKTVAPGLCLVGISEVS